jgi:hypothetical protein
MIRKLPVKQAQTEAARKAATEAFINKGLQVAEQGTSEPESKPKNVLLTIPADEHTRIERVLSNRRVRIPRHTWILEAIVDKLEREEGKHGLST